jgi:hypothetical protein
VVWLVSDPDTFRPLLLLALSAGNGVSEEKPEARQAVTLREKGSVLYARREWSRRLQAFGLSNTSAALHLSRFKRSSRVFSVTFCSPISIRCSDEEEMPSLRAYAGKVISLRRFRRN